MADDLNTAGAITELHKLAGSGDAGGLLEAAQFLGLLSADTEDWTKRAGIKFDALTEKLSLARTAAIESKDFSEVDRIKAVLTNAGVEVRMGKDGVVLVAGPDVDVAKLEELL